ncbi:alpha-amylase family glycosyl hydrolase [Actinomadura fibrosa]|uniref:1,4-alpha-glucan branching enzyme n=1 Tax=Actinomadura fibrosa TaxID=111802 RepID=A0ABW2XCV2_9ACTN|nr:alpha-amylase family glycosyl hydrolase [Actinomadura fibrosa]
MKSVQFVYHTGVPRPGFRDARLSGSWDAEGRPSREWTVTPMEEFTDETGCPAFRATVEFPDDQAGQGYSWGVSVAGRSGDDVWAIPTEVQDLVSTARHRDFVLADDTPPQRYWLNTARRLGANKRYDNGGRPRLEFGVWAPNAQDVSVVFGHLESGYIADDGTGIDEEIGKIPMSRDGEGVWTTDPAEERLADYEGLRNRPYMFEVVKDNGRVVYRTDVYSRLQIGRGSTDPAALKEGESFTGSFRDLDGTVSCSVVVDPDLCTRNFDEPDWPPREWIPADDFWRDEFDPERPLPTRVEDLVIYEMHLAGLGAGDVDDAGRPIPGDIADALALLDHLVDIGVNAVELLPLSEFEGTASWGYGTSHYYAIECSEGGREQLKHFVRACHQRGIAVILDMVYNHYHHRAERAQWAYDSDSHERNIYYWYEGRESDYADPTGGYIDNMSTAWAPRFWEEQVRKYLISSAVAYMAQFHIDGFRMDQTTSIHAYAVLHADGRQVGAANAFGAKFLRELTRSLRLTKPEIYLLAEDHSGWDAVPRDPDQGGLGFDAVWYADFYHHLCGDTGHAGAANLLTQAAIADGRPLAMDAFAAALGASGDHKVVYHESHDEAGNSRYQGGDSGRTIAIAVGDAPLVGETRRYAEARARFAAGMSILSAGTPMFFMGEESGAHEDYRYDDFIEHRESILGEAQGEGRYLCAFYRDLIDLRLAQPAARTHRLDVVHVHNQNRVLAFLRPHEDGDLLVMASLKDEPYADGYRIQGVPDGSWHEVLNSDSAAYDGWDEVNGSGEIRAENGELTARLPRAGFVVLRRDVPGGEGDGADGERQPAMAGCDR